jgi:hypothetical protein
MLKPEPMGDRIILVPFDRREGMSLSEACEVAGKSVGTMRIWCIEHGLGRRVGDGPWIISRWALAMWLDGDHEALASYHLGDRTSELIRPYQSRFEISGTSI